MTVTSTIKRKVVFRTDLPRPGTKARRLVDWMDANPKALTADAVRANPECSLQYVHEIIKRWRPHRIYLRFTDNYRTVVQLKSVRDMNYLRTEAYKRRMTIGQFINLVMSTVAEDRMVDAILDD